MSDWLAPIRAALDASPASRTFFFRDDDAGWGDEALMALLDCFARHAAPIDLAIIPTALTPALTHQLHARLTDDARGRLGVHQHGFAHVNHEAVGRKCEFGPSRTRAQQREDLDAGRAILVAAFGALADPIFTPPWNRCTDDTAACLADLGFRALSRDVGATPLAGNSLPAIPVAVDWCRLRPHETPPEVLGQAIAAVIARSDAPLGIMLHHAVMDDEDLVLLDKLLPLLRTHPMASCVPMRRLLPPAVCSFTALE